MKRHTTVQFLSCSQAYFHICQLWPWPLTSDLQNQEGSSSRHSEHVCQVWWRGTQRFSFYRVHKLISIYVNCDLSRHSEHVCQVWWRRTLRFSFHRVHKVKAWRKHARTDGTTAALLYPLRNALRGDNYWRRWKCNSKQFKQDETKGDVVINRQIT